MSLLPCESKQPVSSLSLHSWYAKYQHCERCAVGIQRSLQLSKQYTQTLCVPTSPPYTRSCLDQTLSSPCPLKGSSPATCQCAHRRGMWRRNLRHFIGALHKPERTDGTLFNFFFYIIGEGWGSLFSRFTLLNLVLFGRLVGPNTLGHEEGYLCVVELDHLVRIFNAEHVSTCTHAIYCITIILIYLCIWLFKNPTSWRCLGWEDKDTSVFSGYTPKTVSTCSPLKHLMLLTLLKKKKLLNVHILVKFSHVCCVLLYLLDTVPGITATLREGLSAWWSNWHLSVDNRI